MAEIITIRHMVRGRFLGWKDGKPRFSNMLDKVCVRFKTQKIATVELERINKAITRGTKAYISSY